MILKDSNLIQLEKCVRITASKADHHKTILVTGPHFYQVITRVNYLTTNLWFNVVKERAKGRHDIELPNKINWLVMMPFFRRKIEEKLGGLHG